MRHEVTAAHAAASPRRLSRNTLVAVALAVSYAFFVVLFPWEAVSRAGFSDFDNYVQDFNYYSASNVSKVETKEVSTLKGYLISEVLWHELVLELTDITGEASIALRIVSFFILFVWGLFLFKRTRPGIALLFLFNPTAIDVAMSGIRNGLAWSLVIIGLSIHSAYMRAVLFVAGVLIHSSTLVLLVLYYSIKFASRLLKGRTILISSLGAGVCIGLALTIGSAIVLGAIGDRRTGEEYVVGGGSFSQAGIWAVLLLLQCLSGREYIRQNAFVTGVLAWYLTMNPFIPWSYRVWGAFLPVIAFSALGLPEQKRQIFFYLYPGYLLLQYLYWTKLFEYWYSA